MHNYDIAIRNTGTRIINKAYVSYNDFTSVGGILPPGIGATNLTPEYPIPEKATVEWRTNDGQLYQKEVEVKKYKPKGFKGTIQFEIDDDNEVTVQFIQD